MDIFQIFHLQTREDKYTFALCEFFKNVEFRNRAKNFFGFDTSDFYCIRESFVLDKPSKYRQKITPDIILYDNHRISVIESKMFSSEGYMQTEDYKNAEEIILNAINQKHFSTKKRTIEYYYFTLTGMLAKNSCFQTIYWFDFYSTTLNNMDFQDEALNCLAAAIRFQANVYNKLISVDNLKNLPYKQLFSDDTYWIRPYTLFVSGVNNDLWGLTATDYSIYNENINGQGHSEFTTNFKKSSWYKIGEQHNDTVHLFIRCEWAKSGLCIYLNWENFDSEAQINEEGIVNNYIATKCLSETVKKQTIKNKHTYMRYWQKPEHLKTVTVTDKKDAVLRILKCCIDCKDKSVGEVLKEAIQVIEYYENEIQRILNGLSLEKGLLIYSSDLPNK